MSIHWEHANKILEAVEIVLSRHGGSNTGIVGIHKPSGLSGRENWTLKVGIPKMDPAGVFATFQLPFVVYISFQTQNTLSAYAKNIDSALAIIRDLLRPGITGRPDILAGFDFISWTESLKPATQTLQLNFSAECKASREDEITIEDLVYYVPALTAEGETGDYTNPIKLSDTSGAGFDLDVMRIPRLGGGFNGGIWRGIVTGRNAHSIFNGSSTGFFSFWIAPAGISATDNGAIVKTRNGEIEISQELDKIKIHILSSLGLIEFTTSGGMVYGRSYWVFVHFDRGLVSYEIQKDDGFIIQGTSGSLDNSTISISSSLIANSELLLCTTDGLAPGSTCFCSQFRFGAGSPTRSDAISNSHTLSGVLAAFYAEDTAEDFGNLGGLGFDGGDKLSGAGAFESMTSGEVETLWDVPAFPDHVTHQLEDGLRFLQPGENNLAILEFVVLLAPAPIALGGRVISFDYTLEIPGAVSWVDSYRYLYLWNTFAPFTTYGLPMDKAQQRIRVTISNSYLTTDFQKISSQLFQQGALTIHNLEIYEAPNYPQLVGSPAIRLIAPYYKTFETNDMELLQDRYGASYCSVDRVFASSKELTLPRVFTLFLWGGPTQSGGSYPWGLWGQFSQSFLSISRQEIDEDDRDDQQQFDYSIDVNLSISDGRGGLIQRVGHYQMITTDKANRNLNHVAAVVDLDAKTIDLYLNGDLMSETTWTAHDPAMGSVSGAIVVNSPAMGLAVGAFVRGFGMVNKALTRQEIFTWAVETKPESVGGV